jgi:hypothetical protein
VTAIYKLWFMNFKEPWYALNQAKQNELQEKVSQALVHHNGKSLLLCGSSSERWVLWGIEEFPDLQSQQMHSLELHNINWHRYISSWSILGNKLSPEGDVEIVKAPIYKIALFRFTEVYINLSPEQKQELNQQIEALNTQFETKVLLQCFTAWYDETWAGFLLEAYPNQEAIQSRHMKLWEMGWYRYARATSMLGLKWPLES